MHGDTQFSQAEGINGKAKGELASTKKRFAGLKISAAQQTTEINRRLTEKKKRSRGSLEQHVSDW